MIERVALGLAVPFVVAAVLAVVLRGSRYGSALGLTVGFGSACALFEWMPWVPGREWEWLPYLGLSAGLIGAATLAEGVRPVERAALGAVLALLTAWLFVWGWESLGDARPGYLFGVAGSLLALGALLDPLPRRFAGNGFLWALAAAAGVSSFVWFTSGSLKFAQLGGAVFAACVGCAVLDRGSARGAVPAFVVILGGLTVAARFSSSSDLPWACYLLPPAAPALLWFGRGRPGAILAAVPLITAVVMAMVIEPFNPLELLEE